MILSNIVLNGSYNIKGLYYMIKEDIIKARLEALKSYMYEELNILKEYVSGKNSGQPKYKSSKHKKSNKRSYCKVSLCRKYKFG